MVPPSLFNQAARQVLQYKIKVDFHLYNRIKNLNTCCWSNDFYKAVQLGHVNCLRNLNHVDELLCIEAAQYNQLSVLRHFFETLGCAWNLHVYLEIGAHPNLECLKYLYRADCKHNNFMLYLVARNGSLECTQFLYQTGLCKWNNHVCESLALNGHLYCLKYAHQNGAVLTNRTCLFAAKMGYLNCLKYAHTHGAPLRDCCTVAAKHGHLKCLKYAHLNGSPLDISVTIEAFNNKHFKCLEYAYKNGAPIYKEICI